jgi:HAMP domain-containing protein
MKLSSLRVKVIGAVLMCLLAAGASILAVVHLTFVQETDQITRDAIVEAQHVFQNLETTDINKMSAVLEAILSNDAFRGSYAEADRQALYARAKPLFERMKSEYHFTLWQYNNPESVGTVFLRLHHPEQFGDPLRRWMYDECVRTKSRVAGKELGHSGFALRVMMPQQDGQGHILGYVEVGEQIGRFFTIMQAQTGNQYGLALKKSLLQRDKWIDFRKSQGKTDNWGDQQDVVAADRTSQDDGLMSAQIDIDGIPKDGEVLGRVSSGGATYVRGVFPVFSADGKRSGDVLVVKDVTAAFTRLGNLELKVAGLILGVMVAISAIIGFMLNSWVFRRLDNMIDIATRVVGGDYECEIRKSADDEVGEFEYLFDQFRKVFLGVVKAHMA